MTVQETPKVKTVARWRADSALMALALIWGATFVVVKGALANISSMYFLTLRFALAALCMGVMFASAFRATPRKELRRAFRGGFIVGVFLWLGYVLQTVGLEYTGAGNSGFLTGLYIVLVPLFSAAIYGRWPRVPELVGIAVASVGLVLLTFPNLGEGFRLNRGDLLTIGCAVVFALHLLVLGHYSQRERFQAVATGQVACAALLSAISLPIAGAHVVWHSSVLGAVVVTGLLATALAFALQTWAQQYTTPTRTALILSLEPVFAFVAAVSVGGEALRLRSAAGGTLILVGILIVELKR